MQPQAQGRAERAVSSVVKWVREVQLSSAMGQGCGGSGDECLLQVVQAPVGAGLSALGPSGGIALTEVFREL